MCDSALERWRTDPDRANGVGPQARDDDAGYARLYDDTVVADYYQAMEQVEKRLPLIAYAVFSRKMEAPHNAGKLGVG